MSTIDSFELHLAAEGKSPRTIRTYADAAKKLASRMLDSSSFAKVTRQDIERHIAGIVRDHSVAYASNQGRALRVFFRWYAAEEDIPNARHELLSVGMLVIRRDQLRRATRRRLGPEPSRHPWARSRPAARLSDRPRVACARGQRSGL